MNASADMIELYRRGVVTRDDFVNHVYKREHAHLFRLRQRLGAWQRRSRRLAAEWFYGALAALLGGLAGLVSFRSDRNVIPLPLSIVVFPMLFLFAVGSFVVATFVLPVYGTALAGHWLLARHRKNFHCELP